MLSHDIASLFFWVEHLLFYPSFVPRRCLTTTKVQETSLKLAKEISRRRPSLGRPHSLAQPLSHVLGSSPKPRANNDI